MMKFRTDRIMAILTGRSDAGFRRRGTVVAGLYLLMLVVLIRFYP